MLSCSTRPLNIGVTFSIKGRPSAVRTAYSMHGDTPLRQFAAALALAVTLEFATGESTMSTQITVVLVSGLPGSGKSMLAECLRQRLSWPLLAKDNLKEILFDTLGVRDRDWSR